MATKKRKTKIKVVSQQVEEPIEVIAIEKKEEITEASIDLLSRRVERIKKKAKKLLESQAV
jgi:hypothetical protein